MGGKPKASDYKASEAEKVSAGIAVSEEAYRREKYGPLALHERDRSEKEDFTSYAAGVSGADVSQMLDKPSLQATQSVDASADRASAGLDAYVGAASVGEATKKDTQLNVLSYGHGLKSESQTRLAGLADMETRNVLASAQRKLESRDQNVQSAFELAGAAWDAGQDNLAKGYTFWGGGKKDPKTGEFKNSRRKDYRTYSGIYEKDRPESDEERAKGRSLWRNVTLKW
ncbi:MAG: hypothetical protein Tp172DCM1112201_12 [Prokaryotic dsDNA virus sp.]|nr:MAG: hypothetical protein Tp172DCM1112201_12 [Prokaryotic dsDNA virus sp.]|tara:strand:- start:14600 stop:15283 length:684 start_codon:yes stop_codon:yes gene_type:complete